LLGAVVAPARRLATDRVRRESFAERERLLLKRELARRRGGHLDELLETDAELLAAGARRGELEALPRRPRLVDDLAGLLRCRRVAAGERAGEGLQSVADGAGLLEGCFL